MEESLKNPSVRYVYYQWCIFYTSGRSVHQAVWYGPKYSSENCTHSFWFFLNGTQWTSKALLSFISAFHLSFHTIPQNFLQELDSSPLSRQWPFAEKQTVSGDFPQILLRKHDEWKHPTETRTFLRRLIRWCTYWVDNEWIQIFQRQYIQRRRKHCLHRATTVNGIRCTQLTDEYFRNKSGSLSSITDSVVGIKNFGRIP